MDSMSGPGAIPVSGASRLARLVAARTLDAELAALVAMLVASRVPAVVAGGLEAGRDELVDGLLELVPVEVRVVEVAGEADEFEWLPEATELGWRREQRLLPAGGRDGVARVSAGTTVLVARDLGGRGSAAVTGARARLVVRALAVGYGLVAGMDAAALDAVLERLHAPDVGTDEDERSRLGLVLVLASTAAGPRITAAHYVRPLARDAHGHLQRLPPAVLATWNEREDRFDHFAWGVLPDLAARTGRTPVAFERDQATLAGRVRRAAAEASGGR